MTLVFGVVLGELMLGAVFVMGPTAWRIWHDDEHMEPGCSFGRQLLGPQQNVEGGKAEPVNPDGRGANAPVSPPRLQ